MKSRLLKTIVGLIILSSVIFVAVWYGIPEECDKDCEIEMRGIGAGESKHETFGSEYELLQKVLEDCMKTAGTTDDGYSLWNNQTHKITAGHCEIRKQTNSGISLDRTVYPDPRFCADEYDKMHLKAAAIPCTCCNPPPGEPVCEPVPVEGHIRDMVSDEFKPCVSTIDSWAHLTEHNDSVWYAFGTNYVKLKMEKTNHEKSIPISITFSGYSQCLNDFHLIVKEHTGERKTVFKETYSQVCDESKPNNEYKTYREIDLDGVGKPIVLDKGQYLVELYTEVPRFHEENYVDKFYFSSHFQ